MDLGKFEMSQEQIDSMTANDVLRIKLPDGSVKEYVTKERALSMMTRFVAHLINKKRISIVPGNEQFFKSVEQYIEK